jgi:hypothetical protein
MKTALSSPALQLVCAAVVLFAFTWPFLVFDRPIYVFGYFFATWLVVIGMLFAFSRAKEQSDLDGDDLDAEAKDA